MSYKNKCSHFIKERNMNNFLAIIGAVIHVLTVGFLLSLILAYPVKWLWNWIIPMLFNLPRINFWEAFGINLLCSLLFKSSSSNSSN